MSLSVDKMTHAIRGVAVSKPMDADVVERINLAMRGFEDPVERYPAGKAVLLICGCIALYVCARDESLRHAFNEIGRIIEEMSLNGAVLITSGRHAEFETEWNLRCGRAVPLHILSL